MKILFVCTHNRCRSILAEAVARQLGATTLEVRSAGSQPAGQVHPLSLQYLAEAGIATDGLQSQSWDAFEDFAPDLVVTVCDSAAGEQCPVWFGKAVKVHWGLKDPSALAGSPDEIKAAFMATIALLERRIRALLAAGPLAGDALKAKMEALAHD
ncbi:arsenate reductase ArsC [Gallaecimonas xiamenensis]|uniref:Protein-tyrosine phosphatase n=1 Tax=Gallaecimonas xiamenensis 3-C-1 TaxID=745411 RepID=K2K4X3_9GAMM|nr:arsenate reductase ArsC [Gallaecimonas xiamenensis]EKE78009.1 protein-tyrosine phosphatase [Gallaecimonas xiamenensis 3-C-1]